MKFKLAFLKITLKRYFIEFFWIVAIQTVNWNKYERWYCWWDRNIRTYNISSTTILIKILLRFDSFRIVVVVLHFVRPVNRNEYKRWINGGLINFTVLCLSKSSKNLWNRFILYLFITYINTVLLIYFINLEDSKMHILRCFATTKVEKCFLRERFAACYAWLARRICLELIITLNENSCTSISFVRRSKVVPRRLGSSFDYYVFVLMKTFFEFLFPKKYVSFFSALHLSWLLAISEDKVKLA